jgi:hypothetical protein
MRLQGVFDGQRVQAIQPGECPQLSLGRLEKPHPDKLRLLVGARRGLVDGDRPDLAAITVEECGDNAHRCLGEEIRPWAPGTIGGAIRAGDDDGVAIRVAHPAVVSATGAPIVQYGTDIMWGVRDLSGRESK